MISFTNPWICTDLAVTASKTSSWLAGGPSSPVTTTLLVINERQIIFIPE